MSFEYLGPTRYDGSDSEDEQPLTTTTAPASFVVRTTRDLPASPTVIIDLTQSSTSDQQMTPLGVIYAPTPAKQHPLGASLSTSAALSRIVRHSDGTVRVLAHPGLASEMQHGWVRAVLGKLQPKRIVVVDSLLVSAAGAGSEAAGAYHTPAVLASVLVLGVAAAVVNYAETYGVPCRHVRREGGSVAGKEADRLFAEPEQAAASAVAALAGGLSGNMRTDLSASLYL